MAHKQVIVSEVFEHNMLVHRPFVHLAPIHVFNYRYFNDIFLKTDWLSKYGIDLDARCEECDSNPGCMDPENPCTKCIVPIDDERNYYINPRLVLDEYHSMLTTIKDLQMTRDHCMQVYPDFEFFVGYPDDSIYGDGSNYSDIQTEEVKEQPRLVGVKREKLDDDKPCAFIIPPEPGTPIIWQEDDDDEAPRRTPPTKKRRQ